MKAIPELDLDAPISLTEESFRQIVKIIASVNPKRIIEFGSGVSTVRLCLEFPETEIISFEHLLKIADWVSALSDRHAPEAHLRIVLTRLIKRQIGLCFYKTYARVDITVEASGAAPSVGASMSPLGVFEDGSNEFFFEPERRMALSRSDVSALAQAKAANYAGQYIVLRRFGMPLEGVARLYLAGGFANYVNVASAIDIGFIANLPLERIDKVGNAALEGATLMLTSRDMRDTAEAMVRNIEHVELETTPDFFDIFVEGCMFKPMQPYSS